MEVFDNHSQKDIAIANVENGKPNATVNVEPNLVPYISDNKVGFANSETQKIVIPCKYDFTSKFSEGLAAVVLNGKWGFIDKNGNEVTHIKYDSVGAFVEGLAPVRLNDKRGFIDKVGNEVIPCRYDEVTDFIEGLAKVKLDDKEGVIDRFGNELWKE